MATGRGCFRLEHDRPATWRLAVPPRQTGGRWPAGVSVSQLSCRQGTLAGRAQCSFRFMAGSPPKDAHLKELVGFKQLRALNIASGATDAGLKELASLTHLQALNLENTAHTRGMKEIAAMKQLRTLTLGRLVDVGLNELAGLEHLRALHIISTSVTDEGVKATYKAHGIADAHVIIQRRRGVGCRSERTGRIDGTAVAESWPYDADGREPESSRRAEEVGGPGSLLVQCDGCRLEGTGGTVRIAFAGH